MSTPITLFSNLKSITTGAVPTAVDLLPGECAFGIITDVNVQPNNQPRLYGNVGTTSEPNIVDLTQTLLNAVLAQYYTSSEVDALLSTQNTNLLNQINAVITRMNAAEVELDDHEGRITLLELENNTGLRSNQFFISLETLTGLEVTGVWNATARRLEC